MGWRSEDEGRELWGWYSVELILLGQEECYREGIASTKTEKVFSDLGLKEAVCRDVFSLLLQINPYKKEKKEKALT